MTDEPEPSLSDEPESSSPTTIPMPVPTDTSQTLSEEQVIDGFHLFLRTALAQAKAERLLDADTLASAQADLMVSGMLQAKFWSSEPGHATSVSYVLVGIRYLSWMSDLACPGSIFL